MDDTLIVPLEKRLGKRYVALVKQYQHSCSSSAVGPSLGAGGGSAVAAVQAQWRFLNNDRISLAALTEPLLRQGTAALAAEGGHGPSLVVHDWSKVLHGHGSDTVVLTHAKDVGYELATALLVSGRDGSPLAPMQMYLKSAAGQMVGTGRHVVGRDTAHIEQVLPTMRASHGWNLRRRLVHVIDREADSVDHYRQWDDAGEWFLVRADDRRVHWKGESVLISRIDRQMQESGQLQDTREVMYHGQAYRQWVGQTTVALYRPGKHRVNGRQMDVPGRVLSLRRVIAQVRDEAGRVLARWWLLSNVPEEQAPAETIALWYYWRWRIESYFKLLKSGGQQIEAWQQETAMAMARRLLVASMACVLAWNLERDGSPDGRQMAALLVRLSGRQMKRTRPVTASALLAGLFVLLPMLALLEEHDNDPTELLRLARATLPYFASG
jgi:hypothetical protein